MFLAGGRQQFSRWCLISAALVSLLAPAQLCPVRPIRLVQGAPIRGRRVRGRPWRWYRRRIDAAHRWVRHLLRPRNAAALHPLRYGPHLLVLRCRIAAATARACDQVENSEYPPPASQNHTSTYVAYVTSFLVAHASSFATPRSRTTHNDAWDNSSMPDPGPPRNRKGHVALTS